MQYTAKDVGYLMLEKDKKIKSKVFQDIIDLSWLWLVIAVMVTELTINIKVMILTNTNGACTPSGANGKLRNT